MNDIDLGYCEGEKCRRNGCSGIIKESAIENCSCHISPPCSACTSPRGYCPECDWNEADDRIINDYVVQVDKATGDYKYWSPRPLDNTRIDWRSKSHSNSSMIKEGVYPEGTTEAQVREQVMGTFGGKFEYFGGGKFKYIAYTD